MEVVLRHLGAVGLAVCLAFISSPSIADTAVLYPDVREPYAQIFASITEGIEKEIKGRIHQLAVAKGSTPAETKTWLDKNKVTGIIALGSRGINSLEIGSEIPTVVGAVVIHPETNNYVGITLNPSPTLLFREFSALMPKIKSIHVVYDPLSHQWIVDAATLAAESLGLKLVPHPADDLSAALKAYQQVQHSIDGETDALWLPLGGPSRDKTILQNVLEESWKRNQAVISSNLSDVKRGALFAMYPDNVGMGQQLARLLMQQQGGEHKREVQFVESLAKAMNLRTAEHLGLRPSRNEIKQFEFIYPPP